MSDSTTLLDTLDPAQGDKEGEVNDLFAAAWPSMQFARRDSASSALTWGYYGAKVYIDGVRTAVANGTVSLSNNTTNYVEVNRSGTVSTNASGWSADKLPLYKVVTSSGTVSSYEDHRDPTLWQRFFQAYATQAMADTNQTLSAEKALAEIIEATGTNTAERNLVVPLLKRQWTIVCSCATNGIKVIGASGTGISIGAGKTAIVWCNGTNVLRVTADV